MLVANAGAGVSARVHLTSDEDWQRMLDLNLTAPFRCLRRALPSMLDTGRGRVVVIASVASKVGEPYISAYTASKHGVLGLVRSAAAEVARSGVTVNAICPGYVDTPMTDATVAGIVARTGRSEDEARQILADKQPNGRLVSPRRSRQPFGCAWTTPRSTGQGSTSTEERTRHDHRTHQPDLARHAARLLARRGRPRAGWCSWPGRPALDIEARIVDGGIVAQFEQALSNLLVALEEAGGRPDQLTSMTIYIVDMDDYRAHATELGRVWRRLVGSDYPAMAGIGVSRLWDADALVEVQGFAVL